MSVKKHPFHKSNVGDLFAVRLGQELWVVIRFFKGGAFGIFPKAYKRCFLPDVDWDHRLERWYFGSWPPSKEDSTELIYLGNILPTNEDERWSPPCFDPPDIFRKSFRIYWRGMYSDASPQQVEEMQQCRRLTPQQLCEFVERQLEKGELSIAD